MMTPDNPRWPEFITRLEGPEGCDFKQSDPDDVGTSTWTCKGGTDKTIAEALLANMGCSPDEIAASLAYFEDRGGYCDCEILFNVAATAA